MIESPRVRPAVERPGRTLDVIGRQVPFAEARGRIAVALKRPHERSALLGHARASSRGTAQGTRRSNRTRRCGGCGRSAARRASGEQIAVTWKPLYRSPSSATRVIAGVETGPPNVDGLPKPASSISTSRTFGAPSGGDGVMLIVQSATEASIVRPIVPPKFGSGIGSTVRSGLNFPIASASDSFNAAHPLLVPLDDRPHHRARERLLDAEPLLVVEHRDDPRRAWRQVLADVVVDLVLDAVIDELADHASRYRTDADRRQQGRREHSHGKPDAATPTPSPCGPGGRPSAALRRCRPPRA